MILSLDDFVMTPIYFLFYILIQLLITHNAHNALDIVSWILSLMVQFLICWCCICIVITLPDIDCSNFLLTGDKFSGEQSWT